MRWLVASLFSVTIIATVGLGWLFDSLYRHYSIAESQQSISASEEQLALLTQVGKQLQATLNGSAQPKQIISHWQLSGQYQVELQPATELMLPQPLLAKLQQGEPVTLATEQSITIYYLLAAHQQYLLITLANTGSGDNGKLTAYLFTSLFYFGLLGLMFAWLYPLAKRLLALRYAAQQFGQGQLNQRVAIGSISYISDLEKEFNRMAQRIEDLIADVKLLSSAVSHDLRTPLASIRFGLDTLQEEDDPKLREKFQHRIGQDVDEMIQLVETLLSYARLDQAMLSLTKTEINLGQLINSLLTNKQALAQHIQLSFNGADSSATVLADKNYLAMLFNNLLQNALQHAKSSIRIELVEGDNEVSLAIGDDGAGIAKAERDNIVKPFVRGAQPAKTKGYGIGLATVSRILHWHNGKLAIDSDPQLKGALFTVTLPK